MADDKIQTQKPKPETLIEIIQKKQASFAQVATKYLTPERLVKLAIVAISKMPDLQKIPAAEIVAELVNCSRLGLEPNVEGGRWLLPFERKGKDGAPNRWELVAITDYRGLIDIARRSGEVFAIHADMRRQADLWEYWIDSCGPTLVHLRHVPADGERGDKVGSYAIVKLKNGETQAVYLSLEEIGEIKASSPSARSPYSPWQRNFDPMAKKSAIRRLYNLLPKTPEIQAAREVLAEEEERERMLDAVDVTAATKTVSGSTTTEKVKAKLAAKTQPKAPPPPAAEPSELGSASAIAQIRRDLIDRLGTNNLGAGWDAATRECAGGKTSDQWTASDVAAVAEYLSTWRPLEVQDYADDGDMEPGSDG